MCASSVPLCPGPCRPRHASCTTCDADGIGAIRAAATGPAHLDGTPTAGRLRSMRDWVVGGAVIEASTRSAPWRADVAEGVLLVENRRHNGHDRLDAARAG